jgi:hypothetical protein
VRRRHEQFIGYFLEELASHPPEFAAELAGMRCHWVFHGGTPMNKYAVAKKAEKLLKRPDITEAIRAHFTELADFTPVDGARKLVEHINGIEYEKTVIVDGQPLTYTDKEKPSLDALKHYHALVLPKPAKHVQVDQRVVVSKVLISDQAPTIRVRELNPAVTIEQSDS